MFNIENAKRFASECENRMVQSITPPGFARSESIYVEVGRMIAMAGVKGPVANRMIIEAYAPVCAEAEKNKKVLRTRIKELRRLRGMSQLQLSQMTGIMQPNLSRIESDSTTPRPQTMEKIATALGVKVEEIINPEAATNGAQAQSQA